MHSRAVYYTVKCISLNSALADGRWSDMDRPRTDNPQLYIRNKDVCPSSNQKNHFFFKNKKIKEKKKFRKKKKKKCYPLSYTILGGRDSIRALQSIPFQILRGGSTSVTTNGTDEQRNFYFIFGQKPLGALAAVMAAASWRRWYYQHRSRDALSPVCGIFLECMDGARHKIASLIQVLFWIQVKSEWLKKINLESCLFDLPFSL